MAECSIERPVARSPIPPLAILRVLLLSELQSFCGPALALFLGGQVGPRQYRYIIPLKRGPSRRRRHTRLDFQRKLKLEFHTQFALIRVKFAANWVFPLCSFVSSVVKALSATQLTSGGPQLCVQAMPAGPPGGWPRHRLSKRHHLRWPGRSCPSPGSPGRCRLSSHR